MNARPLRQEDVKDAVALTLHLVTHLASVAASVTWPVPRNECYAIAAAHNEIACLWQHLAENTPEATGDAPRFELPSYDEWAQAVLNSGDPDHEAVQKWFWQRHAIAEHHVADLAARHRDGDGVDDLELEAARVHLRVLVKGALAAGLEVPDTATGSQTT